LLCSFLSCLIQFVGNGYFGLSYFYFFLLLLCCYLCFFLYLWLARIGFFDYKDAVAPLHSFGAFVVQYFEAEKDSCSSHPTTYVSPWSQVFYPEPCLFLMITLLFWILLLFTCSVPFCFGAHCTLENHSALRSLLIVTGFNQLELF